MADFDIDKVKGNDRYIAGGAVVLLVVSFLSWYSVSAPKVSVAGSSFGGGSTSAGNMWDTWGVNKLAFFLALAAGALVIARLAGALDDVKLPAGVNLITLALSGLATLIFLLRFVTAFKSVGVAGFKISGHPSYGWYLGLLVSGAMTYFAFLNVKASGETLPHTDGTP